MQGSSPDITPSILRCSALVKRLCFVHCRLLIELLYSHCEDGPPCQHNFSKWSVSKFSDITALGWAPSHSILFPQRFGFDKMKPLSPVKREELR